MGAPGVTMPSRSKMLLRGFTGRCAICGASRLTRTWIRIEPRCKRCNFPIERNEGHFVGAVGMNTIVTFGTILITVLIGAGPAVRLLVRVTTPAFVYVSVL